MGEPVAVVGMSCRFPGAAGPDAFWQVLRQKRETITRGLAVSHRAKCELHVVDAFGVLEDIDRFDNRLFGLTAREATLLDPQQRVWLELAWHALEDAGLGRRPDLVAGVFASANRSAYLENNIGEDSDLRKRLRQHVTSETRQIRNGNEREFLPLRTSFSLDLKGPSVNVQTACSSALVAVASACASLRSGESDVCIAGGVSIVRTTGEPMLAEPDAIHSATGRCRPFDAAADGAVFGDGGGAVVLRRLSDALEEGQHIHALIHGWGIANDGGAKASLAAPNAGAQTAAIRKAWQMAGVDAASISYVETHGTGTRLGDPVEFEGLRRAIGAAEPRCWIGSVKSSVGHLDTAAGISGLIKTCLMLDRRSLVPTVGFETPNPLLGLERSRFRVAHEVSAWSGGGGPLHAGVTALGVGGTNCHLALGEAPRRVGGEGEDAVPVAASHLLVVSARTSAALSRSLRLHAECLSSRSVPLASYCRAAARGRRHLEHRAAVAGCNAADLAAGLLRRAGQPERKPSARPRVLFAFDGQLSSRPGMARDLHDANPVFRQEVERCSAILEPELGRPLRDLMFLPRDELARTRYEQPVLCALQIALAAMWESIGIRPAAVVGYSVGEFAAACCAGAVAPEEMLPLVARRGRAMEEIGRPGFMISVLGPVREVEPVCEAEGFEIAGTSGDGFCVVSGPGGPEPARRALEGRGLACRVLTERYGFHSSWVDPGLAALKDAVSAVRWSRPRTVYASATTGRLETELLAEPEYWIGQARRPVRFGEALAAARASGCDHGLEIGPGGSLGRLARHAAVELRWLQSLDPDRSDGEAMQRCLSDLYEAGADIDWRALCPGPPEHRVDLPKYPFERGSFWIGPLPTASPVEDNSPVRPDTLRLAGDPHELGDHRLFGRIVLPASHHVASTLNAIAEHFGRDAFSVEDWTFLRPVTVHDETHLPAAVSLSFDRLEEDPECYALEGRIGSAGAEETVFTARAVLVAGALPNSLDVSPDALAGRFPSCECGGRFYDRKWVNADDTGPAFRRIERIWSVTDLATASIAPCGRDRAGALAAPVIEAGFQALHAGTTIESAAELDAARTLWVPFSIDRVSYRRSASAPLRWCEARHHSDRRSTGCAVGTIGYHDAAGRCALLVEGFHLRPLRESALASAEAGEPLYKVALRPAARHPKALHDLPAALILVEEEGRCDAFAMLPETGSPTILPAQDRENWVDLLGRAPSPLRIAYVTRAGSSGPQGLDACRGLLDLVHALGDLETKIANLAICTTWADGIPTAATASLEGLARVLMNEYPHWNALLVSHDGDRSPRDRAGDILLELAAETPGEHVVYLGGRRLRRVLEPAFLPAEPARLRQDRAYLLVGPQDRQTDLLEDWIIANGAGHITRVAMGDSGVPPREDGASQRGIVVDPASANAVRELSGMTFPLPLAGIFFVPWGSRTGCCSSRPGSASTPRPGSVLQPCRRCPRAARQSRSTTSSASPRARPFSGFAARAAMPP